MKTAAASVLKIFAYLVIVLLGIGGGISGWLMDKGTAFVLIGADIGLGIGFLIFIFIRCLAELYESSKTTADTAHPIPTNTEKNSLQVLKVYKDLLDQGIISQEEFDAKKKQILDL